MIIRIVKMHFQVHEVQAFLKIFDESKTHIRQFDGCRYLQLLESDLPGVLFTYSIWDSREALEKYRQSDLFKSTWAATRRLFRHRAEAWTTTRIEDLP